MSLIFKVFIAERFSVITLLQRKSTAGLPCGVTEASPGEAQRKWATQMRGTFDPQQFGEVPKRP